MLQMRNKVYDVLKIIVMTVLPALSAFYLAISEAWGGFPYTAEIVLTISALTTFLGAFLIKSSSDYHKENDSK